MDFHTYIFRFVFQLAPALKRLSHFIKLTSLANYFFAPHLVSMHQQNE